MLMQTDTQEQAQAETVEEKRLRIVNEVIAEIRPNLQRDGGDCVLVGVDGKNIMVRLTGACMFCKLSAMTLEGIQSRIVEELGELVRLVPVMGGIGLNN